MLEKVHTLGDSLTREQVGQLKPALGDELHDLLDAAFESDTEDEAKERVAAFIAASKRRPMKILKLKKLLTKEQKEIVIQLLDANDG